jgi:sugar phosphate isomerase/epimerase
MKLGIFAKTFSRTRLEEALAAVKVYGLDCVQFNFSSAGLPTLPDTIDRALANRIQSELKKFSLSLAAVSGTCNLIHPEPAQRTKNLSNLCGLIRACPGLGADVVTLCTGTRDAVDMWRKHKENQSPEAWRDLVTSLDQLLPVAQEYGVVLGIEPEPANVISSAPEARKLLDEMKSPWLKIIFDAANLLQPQTVKMQKEVLTAGMDLLGRDVILAHAKDLTSTPNTGHVAAGQGALDYPLYFSLLQSAGFNGPLILHSLTEKEVPTAVAFLKKNLRSTSAFLQS